MSPSSNPGGSAAAAAPLPPLPDLNTSPGSTAKGGDPNSGLMASLMSGIAPIKSSVDAINAACKQIVQSGVIPGAEQICGQIVSLATQLLPMAAQNILQPMQGQQSPGGGTAGAGTLTMPGGLGPMLPPPGGPPPMQ